MHTSSKLQANPLMNQLDASNPPKTLPFIDESIMKIYVPFIYAHFMRERDPSHSP
jgi:hypothetical protein